MATDTGETPSSPSQPPSHSIGQPRHFYLAVDRLSFKMETLVDLLGVVGRRSGLPIVVCCSSRDELDAVCSTASSLPYISLSSLVLWICGWIVGLHMNLLRNVLKCFTIDWTSSLVHFCFLMYCGFVGWIVGPIFLGKGTMCCAEYSDLAESDRAQILENFRHAVVKWNQSAVGGEDEEEGFKSHMVVVTDACLPIVSSESPLPARILINYELPAKKEIYMRRMTACLASDGIVINMVVGGEVVTLKSIEEASNLIIAEMPIQVSEIL